MTAGGQAQRPLTTGLESTSPAWSPDGRRIVFDRNDQITVMSADGSGVTQLTRPDGRAHENPSW